MDGNSLTKLDEMGYKTVLWSLAYKDWDQSKKNGSSYSHDIVLERIHNGAIILMHIVSSDNSNALPKIISDLRIQGYEISSLRDLV